MTGTRPNSQTQIVTPSEDAVRFRVGDRRWQQEADGERIAAALLKYRFRFVREDELQAAITAALDQEGVPAEREARLGPRDRIDLLAGGVGIEVKVDGSTAAVERQIARYTSHEEIDALILVTVCARHLRVARESNGKPVYVLPTFAP